MAESIFKHAATLKEAQIMSNEMEKFVVFQFTIVDEGHTFQSSYDLVLNGISAEDDEFLDMAQKPCVGIRVMDFETKVVHLWSLEKLQNRVGQMRQIYQYLDRPEYLQVSLPPASWSVHYVADIPGKASPAERSLFRTFSPTVLTDWRCRRSSHSNLRITLPRLCPRYYITPYGKCSWDYQTYARTLRC
jgi:hypothetical protein